jgi:hypothetical protein
MRIAALFAIAMLLLAAAAPRVLLPVTAAECDPNYEGFCVPLSSAVTCDDIKTAVKVVGNDTRKLDRDNDGTGCDEYATESGGNGLTNGNNGQTAGNGGGCSTVFVAGKGVIDSCSGNRKPTSRVYPRKPGVPPEGCAGECPEVAEAPKPSGTPAPSGTPRPVTPSQAGPIESEYTPPIDTGATPVPAQNCDRVSYPDVCVPVAPPYLSCTDIPDRNFRVRAPDPHRFDADGNGIGCEEVRGPTIGR